MRMRLVWAWPVLLLVVPWTLAGIAPTGKNGPAGLTGKMVTLVADGLEVGEALKSITHDTDIPVADRRTTAKGGTVVVAVKQASFWQALDAVAREAKCAISLYQPDGVIALVDGKPLAVPPSHSGIFRTTVKQIELTHKFEIDKRIGRVSLELAWEPWFEPFSVEVKSYHGTFTPAKSKENSAFTGLGKGAMPVHGRSSEEILLQGAAPDRSATKLEALKGELSVIGAAGMWTVRFAKLGGKKPQKQTQGDASATLKRFEILDKGVWEAEIELRYPDGGPEFESFQSWLVHNTIHLENRKNKSITFVPRSADEEQLLKTNNRAVIVYRFAERKGAPRLLNPADWELVYRTPARLVQVSVPFAFPEVPLP